MIRCCLPKYTHAPTLVFCTTLSTCMHCFIWLSLHNLNAVQERRTLPLSVKTPSERDNYRMQTQEMVITINTNRQNGDRYTNSPEDYNRIHVKVRVTAEGSDMLLEWIWPGLITRMMSIRGLISPDTHTVQTHVCVAVYACVTHKPQTTKTW